MLGAQLETPECSRVHSPESRRSSITSEAQGICKPDRVPVFTAAAMGLTEGPDHLVSRHEQGYPASSPADTQRNDLMKMSRRTSRASESTAAGTDRDSDVSSVRSPCERRDADSLDMFISLGDPRAPGFLFQMGGRDW
jgi:hypothetical protein